MPTMVGEGGNASVDSSAAPLGGDVTAWLNKRLEVERASLLYDLEDWLGKRIQGSHQALISELRRASLSLSQSAEATPTKPATSQLPEHTKLHTAPSVHCKQNCGDEPAKGPGESEDNGTAPQPETKAAVLQKSETPEPTKPELPEAEKPEPPPLRRKVKRQKTADAAAMEMLNGGADSAKKLLGRDKFRRSHTKGMQPSTAFGRFVDSDLFELMSLFMILANTMVMALSMQYEGFEAGYELGAADFYLPAEERWPHMKTTLQNLNIMFNILFTVELLMRYAAMKSAAFRSSWIWFDTVLVGMCLLEMVALLSIDPSALRTIRLIRVLRTARLGRLASAVQDLFLLVRSIRASMGALFWSFVLLLLVQIGTGMILQQTLKDYMLDVSYPTAHRVQVFEYFGTFSKTMISMFEITFANWVICCRTLMIISEWYGYFFIVYRCILCFALVKVIAAVFIAETNRVVQSDEELQRLKKKKVDEMNQMKIQKMFSSLDQDEDGTLSWDEFEEITNNPELKEMAASLDLHLVDMEHLFKTIDTLGESDGKISIDEFVEGLRMMRMPAVSIDVLNVLKVVNRLERRLNQGTATARNTVGNNALSPPRRSSFFGKEQSTSPAVEDVRVMMARPSQQLKEIALTDGEATAV